MPKRKDFLHSKKRPEKTSKLEAPRTENDYLAAGVHFEEAGEKWRAGDAAKSLRVFTRAVEAYDAGLEDFPNSFDLAYNKARIQYEVAQQPRLLVHLPTALIDLLEIALDSHRAALTIKQEIPDLLFNTAQVLTSLAEAITEDKQHSHDRRRQALHLLQEALELFQRCLNLQEYRYEQAQEDAAETAEEPLLDGNLDPSNVSASEPYALEEEIWALVEEPITKSTLLDTVVAQLETLTALCSLGSLQGHSGLAWIEEFYRNTLQGKFDYYVEATTRQHEVALTKAKFVSAISDAAFRSGRLDFETYEREIAAAFTGPELSLANDPQGLCDRADVELSFNNSIQVSVANGQLEDIRRIASVCWKHITRALESLTGASKLPDALHLARIHLRRGDCEMLRLRLGEAPLKYDLAIQSMPTLLKNAEVYYRGAAALAKRNKADEEEGIEADVKETIAAALGGDTQRLTRLMKTQRNYIETIVQEMKDEGILGDESLQRLDHLPFSV